MSNPESSPAVTADERHLVARFLTSRNESCFRTLYRRHTPFLLLLALRLTGGRREDAEDAVQETWIRAVRKLEEFRWEASLRSWLCAITINCCRETIRRRKSNGQSESAPPPPGPSNSCPSTQLQLESLIRELPDGYREVLVLHDVEGHTHDEISRLLGISAGTSKSQLFRARKTLRAWLDESPGQRKEEP